MQTGWKQYLIGQAKMHPSMTPQDVYKMIFQAAFGAEHILQDEDAAWEYLKREYEEVQPGDGLLYEQIAGDIYRMNLRAWKKKNLPPEWLFRMFVGSVRGASIQDNFRQYAEEAAEVVKEGIFTFSTEEFLRYTEEYNPARPHAVHHSESYRAAERPSYRLVSGKYLRVLPIVEAMAAGKVSTVPADADSTEYMGNNMCRNRMTISIDGRCASGKSTMAEILSEITGAGVVHMDDFYLPAELRTKERLEQPGGNIHYERFREEVMSFLKTGAFTYRKFDCSSMQLGEERKVADNPYCIVEGAYSTHPIFGEYADLQVFSDVDAWEQLRRIGNRDGEEYLSMFKQKWIPMEEKYFQVYQIKEKADIIV